MASLQSLLLLLDPWLIGPFRWPASAEAGYVLGISLLVLQCILIGDVSATIVAYLNRNYLRRLQANMDRHHWLSEEALKRGDKASYKAVNSQALDAFGYSFSMGAAIFSVSIWPLPFALAWLHPRFAEAPLELPGALPFYGGRTVPYLVSFILLYILVRLAYSKVMAGVPVYAAFKAKVMGKSEPHGVTPADESGILSGKAGE